MDFRGLLSEGWTFIDGILAIIVGIECRRDESLNGDLCLWRRGIWIKERLHKWILNSVVSGTFCRSRARSRSPVASPHDKIGGKSPKKAATRSSSLSR